MGMAAGEAQFHVLAVDDSLIDRKLIERLLKTSSYQGILFFFSSSSSSDWIKNCFLEKIVIYFVCGCFAFFLWQLLQLILVARLLNFLAGMKEILMKPSSVPRITM